MTTAVCAESEKVNVLVESENQTAQDLGIALPAGACRVYKASSATTCESGVMDMSQPFGRSFAVASVVWLLFVCDSTLAGGALYNNLDYSFTPAHPDGSLLEYRSPGGGSPDLRRQLRILKDFMHAVPFVRMVPDKNVIRRVEPTLVASAPGEPGQAYAIYLHVPLPKKPKDIRRYLRTGVAARLTLDLPAGRYSAEWINTKTERPDAHLDFNTAHVMHIVMTQLST